MTARLPADAPPSGGSHASGGAAPTRADEPWRAAEALAARYAWLFGVDALAPTVAPDPELARALVVEHWPVAPLTARRLAAWAGTTDDAALRPARDRAIAVAVLARLQRTLTARLAAALDAAGIPYAFFKGAATALVAYEQDDLRGCGDLDLAVPRPWLGATQALVRAHGFAPAQWNTAREVYEAPDPALRARAEAEHHELGFHIRRQRVVGLPPGQAEAIRRTAPFDGTWFAEPDGSLHANVGVDVHHGVWMGHPVDALVRDTQTVRWDGVPIRVARTPWLLLVVIYKLYWEGVQHYRGGVYQLADLVRLVGRLTPDEAVELVDLLAHANMLPGAHYVLRRLPGVFGVTLPAPLAALVAREALAPVRGRPDQHNDRGDYWPRLWGYR